MTPQCHRQIVRSRFNTLQQDHDDVAVINSRKKSSNKPWLSKLMQQRLAEAFQVRFAVKQVLQSMPHAQLYLYMHIDISIDLSLSL